MRTTQTNKDKKDFENGNVRRLQPNAKKKGRSICRWDFKSSCQMQIRIVRFQISENSYETIATSLPAKQFPLSVIEKLYAMRWGIETRHWSYKFPRKEKWEYQANFTMGIHVCRTYFRICGIDLPDIDLAIRKYILPVRPGRSDIRKVKPKGPVFFLYKVA